MGGGLLVGPVEQGRGALRVPARDADHRRGRGAQAARALRSEGDGVRGQALVGSLCSAVTAYLAVRFLLRFFETNRLTPFAVYCALAGAVCAG